MGRRPSDKTPEQKSEELRRYNREYMKRYRELHRDELNAKRRELRRNKSQEDRERERQYMKHYIELHHDEILEKQREKRKEKSEENKLKYVNAKLEYWSKRLEELENQNKEAQ